MFVLFSRAWGQLVNALRKPGVLLYSLEWGRGVGTVWTTGQEARSQG